MRGLFDRLEHGARDLDEARSIGAHLRVLFGSCRGSTSAAPELGRPDLTDLVHTWPEGVRAVERALRALVERFEPRLTDITVRAVTSADPLVLSFQVRGRATREPGRVHRFVTEIDSRGRCIVR